MKSILVFNGKHEANFVYEVEDTISSVLFYSSRVLGSCFYRRHASVGFHADISIIFTLVNKKRPARHANLLYHLSIFSSPMLSKNIGVLI